MGVAESGTSRDAGWPLRLVQWLLILAYFSAFVSKVGKGAPDWANGYTLQYFTFVKGTELGRPFGVWLSEQHGLCVVLSWATLAFEGTFALVLVPRLRAGYLAAGTLFHVEKEAAMAASFFQFLALYAVFVPWETVRDRLRARGLVTSGWRDGLGALRGWSFRGWLGSRLPPGAGP